PAGGASKWGARQMFGDVWEWTSSDFGGYPGFAAFPYREYSEVFFGSDYKVLRGGSWATHPAAMRSTFRNWDYPIRRQLFSGFRSPGDPSTVTGTAPAVPGPWLFSLNGAAGGLTRGVGDERRAGLSATRLAGIEGASDSEVLFALTLDRLDAGDAPAAALSHV